MQTLSIWGTPTRLAGSNRSRTCTKSSFTPTSKFSKTTRPPQGKVQISTTQSSTCLASTCETRLLSHFLEWTARRENLWRRLCHHCHCQSWSKTSLAWGIVSRTFMMRKKETRQKAIQSLAEKSQQRKILLQHLGETKVIGKKNIVMTRLTLTTWWRRCRIQ